MENTIQEWFCQVENDKFTKITTKKSTRGFFFEIPTSFLESFRNPDLVSCDATFVYSQRDNEDLLRMQLRFFYEGPATANMKKINFLPTFNIILLLDGDDTIDFKKGVHHKKDINEFPPIGTMHVTERIDFDLPIDAFIKLANSKKIEWKIMGLGEGEFSQASMMALKGFYNSVFDEEFEKEILLNWIETKQKNIEEDKKKQEEEKEKNNVAGTGEERKRRTIESPPTKPKYKAWIQFFVLFILLIAGKNYFCNKQKLTGSAEASVSSTNSQPNSASNNTEPGYYRVGYEAVDGITSYKNVLKTKTNSKKLKPMQKISISSIEDGMGYFDSFLDDSYNQIPGGWVDMRDLIKSALLDETTYYKVKSTEIDGAEVYKDYLMKKKYKSRLEPMKDVRIVLVVDNKLGYADDLYFSGDYNKYSGWVELSKLEKK
jgi:hypothetical protein